MARLLRDYPTEAKLLAVLLVLCAGLSLASPSFLSPVNLASLLNNSAVNVIWAVGLLVVLIAGGIDISFAVAASVVQVLAVHVLEALGGGTWILGFVVAIALGVALGWINAALIHGFGVISIVVTIATFNAFFGLMMWLTAGRGIYSLPSWWTRRILIWEHQTADGSWAELTLAVAVMLACMLATWVLIRHTTVGRQLYAFGDNPEGARRIGIRPGAMWFVAFGWMGAMAGIAGLMQVNITREVVPNALYGRELDVLAAVVLGGARLGGGRGSVIGCFLGVMLVAITQNGLNLLGVSPYAFKMVVGAIILIAISTSGVELVRAQPRRARP
ncbi:ABC transporter permease [Rubellimicrobium arenae]|uniref:ABC transporter permease n=1 Tax=Rubellimicrobium arenae TaxID=2817372 RepID=UPI001B304ADF|nr:ABC transporter permease [Rubellimicrobium arenae]